ncbi:polymorphic toxin type 17 domain-containing protein [Streptomyces sp. NPDC048442]|uniref:polymorphic toxin type 17 domain-containing protein n=1 Tax=Streptomyces sp. NPDC048442 TaxID=3154823 RepID=UPI0034381333
MGEVARWPVRSSTRRGRNCGGGRCRSWRGGSPKNTSVNSGLLRGPSKGYIDRFGNEWTRGPSRTEGQAFEWDVQLSKTGKAKVGWLSRDARHLNVSLDGEITHR